ncbi:zinc finger matrin-type protein 1-like [Sceloporus undulatus]|uniref:zinc finger matrin-type protein 1-like n=1 Tax=Sceloporus undulatus TaxID=8520 RepID=UPI001C4B8BFF|nr:zinc finger matrin-type protein 1-like [Sceloporus undulatus]
MPYPEPLMESNADKNSYCRLCNMIFTSPVVAQSHYLGKIHTKKMKLLSDQSQQPSQSPQLEPGSSGSWIPTPPELSLEKTSQDSKTEDPHSLYATTLDKDDPEKYCKLCSISFNNPVMANQHYVGKKHKRNEVRKKLLAEMGTSAIPVEAKANAVGVGNYVCPICSISLSSIEMYQSHMQGNKHQIKENMIAKQMKKSKITYASFQDELEDYIAMQKARGLEPKTKFRKPEEKFKNKECKAINGHKDIFVSKQDQFSCDIYELGQHSIFFSETSAYSFEKPLLHRSPADKDSLKLENGPMSQCSTEYCSEKQVSCLAINKDCNYNPLPVESSKADNTGSYERSQKLSNTSRMEKECISEGEESPLQQPVKLKRKQHSEEETDSGKDVEKKKKKKDEMDSTGEGKSKHNKDKSNKESSSEKESKKHKKEKKRSEANGPSDEEMLWNESILGF